MLSHHQQSTNKFHHVPLSLVVLAATLTYSQLTGSFMITQVSQVPAALCPPAPVPDPCMLCLGVLVNMTDRWSSGTQATVALIRSTFISSFYVVVDGQLWWF